MASATAQQQTASSSSNFQQARLPSELQVELKPILDVKILEKLEMFNGRSECWESWLTGFESLAGLIGLDNLMAISVQPGLSWSETALSQLGGDDVRLKAKALWYLLTQACKGKSQNIIKKAEKFNGVQAWKLLMEDYRPVMAGRFTAMLLGLLQPTTWDQDTQSTSFLEVLGKWENDCDEYVTQSGKRIDDETKIAVVTGKCPASVAWVVRMAAMQCGDKYDAFKKHIEMYMVQVVHFASDGHRLNDPMDVGGINFKGGKKGGKPQGPTAGKQYAPSLRAGAVCTICQKTNHTAKDCWHKTGASGKGKDGKKGGQGGKGQPSPQPPQGGWQQRQQQMPKPGAFTGTCNFCGKTGHKAVDCRQKAKGTPPRTGGVIASDVQSEASTQASTMASSAGALGRRQVGGVTTVEYVGSQAQPYYVLGMTDTALVKTCGGVTVPEREIADGEWLWASLDSGSDAHTVPEQVDMYGDVAPLKHLLEDIQGGSLKATGSKTIAFDAQDSDGVIEPFAGVMIVSKTKKFVLSTGVLDKAGYRTMNDDDDSYLECRKTLRRWPVKMIGNTYYLRVKVRTTQPPAMWTCGGCNMRWPESVKERWNVQSWDASGRCAVCIETRNLMQSGAVGGIRDGASSGSLRTSPEQGFNDPGASSSSAGENGLEPAASASAQLSAQLSGQLRRPTLDTMLVSRLPVGSDAMLDRIAEEQEDSVDSRLAALAAQRERLEQDRLAVLGQHQSILSRGSTVQQLKGRLVELGGAIWGTKAQLHDRLMLAEAKSTADQKTRFELVQRQKDIASGVAGREMAVLPVPTMPSPAEVAKHNLSHLPRERWCITCQLSTSNDDPHPMIANTDKVKPRTQFDFMYLKSDQAVCEFLEDQPPLNEWCAVLTGVDEDSGCRLALAIPTKALEHPYALECSVDFIKRLGHVDVTALRDQEPALLALVDRVVVECRKLGIKVDPRDAPRYSHASMGAIGRAQQSIQKQFRALRTDVSIRYGLWLSPDRPAHPWMVRHAPWLLDRFHVKANGRTAYEDAFGTAYAGPVCLFLECCLFRRTKSDTGAMTRGRRAQKADNQWDQGLWLGRSHISNEHILGTEHGTEMARSIKRLPEHLQVDKELLELMKGTPWDPQLTAPRGRKPRKPQVVAMQESPLSRLQLSRKGNHHRRPAWQPQRETQLQPRGCVLCKQTRMLE